MLTHNFVTLFSVTVIQLAKKVLSDSPGLVDFAIGLVNSLFNLPNRQVMSLKNSDNINDCEINSASQKVFGAG